METLDVALNRTGLKEADAPETFAVDGSFAVALRNHGEAAHVHLQLDDALRRVASIEATNHFVDGGAERLVTVEIREPDDPVTGTLAIVTGHGAETTTVRVTVHPDSDDPVEVDESLAAPGGDTAGPSTDGGGGGGGVAATGTDGGLAADLEPQGVPDTATLAVVVLAVMVVIVAGVIAVTFNSPVVTIGVAAVVVSVAVAGYLLVT